MGADGGKVSTGSLGGLTPIKGDDSTTRIGGEISGGVGLNVHRFARFELGFASYDWGGLMPSNKGFFGKVSTPVRFMQISEVLAGVSFSGSSSKSVPSHVFYLGIGKLF